MSRHTILSRLLALALLGTPALALAGTAQPCAKCAQPCAGKSSVQPEGHSKGHKAPSPSISSEEQQRIWTSP